MINAATSENRLQEMDYLKNLKERFKKTALEGFYSSEVMELLLSYGAPGARVAALSSALIQRFKCLRATLDAPSDELRAVAGMRDNSVIFIKLLKETAGIYLRERMMKRDVVRSGRELLDYLNMTLSGERIEKFLAVYLNSAMEILAVETLFEGTINQTAVYPRKVVEKALKHNAHGVIFVHNHPSGDSAPSETDKQLTIVLERAAKAIDLNVVDHIIIGRGPHFSAREKGWMGAPPRAASRTGRSENMIGTPAAEKDGA